MSDYERDLYERFFEATRNPDPHNPYKFNGVNYAPEVLSRIMDSEADVARVIAEAICVHELDEAELASDLDLPQEEFDALARSGRMEADVFYALMERIGVNPVSVPPYVVYGVAAS